MTVLPHFRPDFLVAFEFTPGWSIPFACLQKCLSCRQFRVIGLKAFAKIGPGGCGSVRLLLLGRGAESAVRVPLGMAGGGCFLLFCFFLRGRGARRIRRRRRFGWAAGGGARNRTRRQRVRQSILAFFGWWYT